MTEVKTKDYVVEAVNAEELGNALIGSSDKFPEDIAIHYQDSIFDVKIDFSSTNKKVALDMTVSLQPKSDLAVEINEAMSWYDDVSSNKLHLAILDKIWELPELKGWCDKLNAILEPAGYSW